MNSKKKIIIASIFLIVFLMSGSFLLTKRQTRSAKQVITAGLSKGQKKHFAQELSSAFNEFELIEKGSKLIDEGKIEEAIAQFEYAQATIKSFNIRAVAEEYLVGAYEKNLQYEKAYNLKKDIMKDYKLPPLNAFRMPEEERLLYLKHASKGNFDLALQHAKKAAEDSTSIPTNKTGSPLKDYANRLNDLTASKDYILSLKKG